MTAKPWLAVAARQSARGHASKPTQAIQASGTTGLGLLQPAGLQMPVSHSPTHPTPSQPASQMPVPVPPEPPTRSSQENAAVSCGRHSHHGHVVGRHRVEGQRLQRHLLALVAAAAGAPGAAHTQQHDLRVGAIVCVDGC